MSLKGKLAILGAITAIGVIALTGFTLYTEKTQLINDRKEQIKVIVEVGTSQLAFFEAKVKAGELTLDEAQTLAKDTLRKAKYSGQEYFWINDKHPKVVMHGANDKLEGKDVSDLKDPNGKKLFVEFVDTVNKSGEGYVDYLWKKPGAQDTDAPVAKISFVKEFQPWGWILGTGLYLDDLEAKFIANVKSMAVFTGAIVLLLMGSLYLLANDILKGLGADPDYVKKETDTIAAGDLTSVVKVKQGDTSSLAQSLMGMQTTLKKMIGTIVSSSKAVDSASGSLIQMSSELETSATQQAESASAMAASVEEMVVSIDVIRSNSAEARELAEDSGKRSQEGSVVITGLISEMQSISSAVKESATILEDLGSQSEQISSIVRTIKDIADQTNLLALNAAIEAARAGEQGRGFAVVADEVRKLAERTSVATGEITGMVSKIQSGTTTAVKAMQEGVTKVNSGVDSAQAAGQSITEIKQSSDKVISVINDISGALEEQSSASNHVAQQLENISQMSEYNMNQVKVLATNSNELAQMSKTLSASVASFKV